MRIFLCEWKKLLSFRIFWILLACLLLVNGYVQVDGTKDRYYKPETYRSFFAETEVMPFSETYDYLNELIERQSTGDYTEYPMILIYDLLEISEQMRTYPEYLESIEVQSDNMSSVSIWGGKDTFSYRNIQKTPPAYTRMDGTELELAPSLGLEDTFTAPLSDVMGIFLVLLVVCAVMLRDREQGVMPLLYSMQKGRHALILNKLAVIAVSTVVIAVLFFGENLLIGAKLYGLGDLSRPIQTVMGYYTCNLPVSVREYLLLFFGMKMLSYFLFAGVFSLICVCAKNNLMVYGISGAFCGVSFLLYYFIPEYSVFGLLRFLNPVQFTQVSEIFGTYRNINLFGYPFSHKISALIMLGVVLTASVTLAVIVFAKAKNLQYRNVSLRLFKRKKQRIHGRFYYVCYRSLILQKGIALVLITIFAAGMLHASFGRSYNNDDIYYENFTVALQGEITQETYDFLADKENHYAEIEQQIAELETQENFNIYKLNQLYSEMSDRTAFERLQARIEAIDAGGSDGEIFYDTGYERLFGIDGNNEDMVQVLLMLLFLALLLSPFAASDRKTNMVKILFSTRSGKIGYWKDLSLYSALCGTAVSLLFTLPYQWNILDSYGTQGLSAPIQSIGAFAHLDIYLTAGGMILLQLIIRTVSASITAVLISGISSICRSPMTAYLANIGYFVLPAGLTLLGVNVLQYVHMLPLLSYNRLILLM